MHGERDTNWLGNFQELVTLILIVQDVLAPDVTNLEVQLWERFHGFFFHSLLASPSYEVKVSALLASRDLRSNLGSNLAALKEKTKLDPWTAARGQLREP